MTRDDDDDNSYETIEILQLIMHIFLLVEEEDAITAIATTATATATA